MLAIGLLPEVFILCPGGFGEYRGNDLVTFDGDSFSGVFLHEFFLLEDLLVVLAPS